MDKTPPTLVRIGRYDSSLEEAVKGFSVPLTRVNLGFGNTVKYAAFDKSKKPYFLMVSQQIDKATSVIGHNVTLSVTSDSNLMNHEIANKFERETGIDLSIDVPEQLREYFQLIGVSFMVYKEKPEAAMDFLRGM